jgi:FMN phosphatase YigB (HAD superfamily)
LGAGLRNQNCLDELEVSAEKALFIGDHPVNDIDGSAKAGMTPLWLDPIQLAMPAGKEIPPSN